MLNRKLTKAQMKELREFLISTSAPSRDIEDVTRSDVAWDNYQRMRDIKTKAASRLQAPVAAESSVSSEPVKRRGRGPGKKPAKQVTTVQLDPDMLEGLQEVAERDERTVSAVIRLAIRDYLEKVNG